MDKEEKIKKSKLPIVLIITIILAIGVGIGVYFVYNSMGYLTTDNARVTTDLITVTPSIPGPLERFNLYEGQIVEQNQVLGWVENDNAMRSPVDAIVLYTSARASQFVLPGEPIAVLGDLNRIHITANIEETDIGKLYLNQRVNATIDTFGNQRFGGYISNIGRITQAELTGTAMFFNTGGNFTRVTHLFPIEITITDDIDLTNLIGVNARISIPLR